jgi:hypothetical protein
LSITDLPSRVAEGAEVRARTARFAAITELSLDLDGF